MKRRIWVGGGILLVMLGVGSVVLRSPKVPWEANQSAVKREPGLLERAWALPAAASYRRELAWQRNG